MLQKIIDFLLRPWSTQNAQDDLEAYIMSKRPTNVVEVEQLTRKFLNNRYSHL